MQKRATSSTIADPAQTSQLAPESPEFRVARDRVLHPSLSACSCLEGRMKRNTVAGELPGRSGSGELRGRFRPANKSTRLC